MDTKELQQMVNPVYTTAKGTVLTLASSGDKDAIALVPFVNVEEITNGVTATVPEEIRNCYKVAQQARYEIYNKAAFASTAPNIVDLPSGYSPRGFRTAGTGKRYFGFDLPVVIDVMKAAAEKTMTDEQKAIAEYAAVDATNYESMKAALGDVKGELCIVTEGLLGYFSEPELVSFCQAIHRLLSEHGGCWITADTSIIQIYTLTFATILKGDTEAFNNNMKGMAGKMADVDFYKNSLFLKGIDGADEFLKGQGLDVKRESIDKYLPDLPGIDPALMKELREAYSVMEMWTMSVKDNSKKTVDESLPFAVESKFENGKFSASIQGRMDTITAPELLKRFKEVDGKIEAIEVNMEKLSYVSSAGLRVLLMMCKSLEDKSSFNMINVNDEVKEILEVTGFDQLLM